MYTDSTMRRLYIQKTDLITGEVAVIRENPLDRNLTKPSTWTVYKIIRSENSKPQVKDGQTQIKCDYGIRNIEGSKPISETKPLGWVHPKEIQDLLLGMKPPEFLKKKLLDVPDF